MSGRARRGPARPSLRARLVLITTALLAVGLVASGSVLVRTLRDRLIDQLDGQLSTLSVVLSRLPGSVIAAGGGAAAGDRGAPLPLQTSGLALIREADIVYLNPDGTRRQEFRLYPAGAAGPALPRLDGAAVAARAGSPFTVRSTGGSGSWRVRVLPRATGPAGGEGSVVIAARLDEVESTVATMRTVCLLTAAVTLALLALVGWFAVGAGLRPLRRVEQTAASIAAGELSHRVPELAPPRTEVGRLTAALNGMLAQIERAFAARADSEDRMRRFVADASHELRTPLFGIRGFTQLYLMGGLPAKADVDRGMTRIDQESARLVDLVEDLLLLTRVDEAGAGKPSFDGAGTGTPSFNGDGAGGASADGASAGGDGTGNASAAGAPSEAATRSGQARRSGLDVPPLDARPAPMDLRALAADARYDLRTLDPTRTVRLTGPGGGPAGPAEVVADEAWLRRVLSNVVGNVIAHTPAGGPVRIGVGTVGGEAVLEIEDSGPGLDAGQAQRVFDRFYRADPARGRTAGAGLGLAIVKSLVTASGGRIELDTAPGAGATFRIVLPARSG